jgi:transcriptional regulator with XRE-family HTH domain
MNLISIGRLIAEQRRAKGFTLTQLAAKAEVGRSTLAALESGKLPELGLARVSRLCAALDLVLEAMPLHLDAPIMEHRHLTELAGRELTKAAIDDIVSRGDVKAWRGLMAAMRSDKTGRITKRVVDTVRALAKHDGKAKAFANMLSRQQAMPVNRPRKQ